MSKSRMKLTVVSMSRIEGGTISSGKASGTSFPFKAGVSINRHGLDIALTSIDKTHGNVKFRKVQFSTVGNIGKSPNYEQRAPKEKGVCDGPDFDQIILRQSTLPEDFSGSFTRNKAITLLPSAENLIVILLFLLRERPWHFWCFDLRILDQRLEGICEWLVGCRVELRYAGLCEWLR